MTFVVSYLREHGFVDISPHYQWDFNSVTLPIYMTHNVAKYIN